MTLQDSSKPIWFNKDKPKKQIKLCVGTPVHSEVSIHYTQCLLEIQKEFITKGNKVSFLMHKSSLITQGRNLTVASFLETSADYLLFLDSDIAIGTHVVERMIGLEDLFRKTAYLQVTLFYQYFLLMEKIRNNP